MNEWLWLEIVKTVGYLNCKLQQHWHGNSTVIRQVWRRTLQICLQRAQLGKLRQLLTSQIWHRMNTLIANYTIIFTLPCSDTVGWATGRAYACKTSATTVPKSLLLGTSIIWSTLIKSNSRKRAGYGRCVCVPFVHCRAWCRITLLATVSWLLIQDGDPCGPWSDASAMCHASTFGDRSFAAFWDHGAFVTFMISLRRI